MRNSFCLRRQRVINLLFIAYVTLLTYGGAKASDPPKDSITLEDQLSTEATHPIGPPSTLTVEEFEIKEIEEPPPPDPKQLTPPPTIQQISPLAPELRTTIEGINFDEDGNNNSAIISGGMIKKQFHIPPDPIGAVGPNHLVSTVNTSIEWHTKDGVQQNSQRLGADPIGSVAGSFFGALSPANDLFDTKVIYDQYENRFLVVALEKVDNGFNDPSSTSRILVAVSDDSDPNGPWFFHAIDTKVNINGDDHWADYPGLAVDEEAVYVTAGLFTFEKNAEGGTRLWIIDKGVGTGGLYDGGAARVTSHDPAQVVMSFADRANTLQPAHVFGTDGVGPGIGTFLIRAGFSADTDVSGLQDEALSVIRVDDPLGLASGPEFTHQFIFVGNIEDTRVPILDAPQLGSSILINAEFVGRRALHAVWRNDSLWVTAQIVPSLGDDADQTTAHWWQIDTTNPASLALDQQGNVGGEEIATGTYTFYPSIGVDREGNMAIGFAASGDTIFPGAYYTGRRAEDSPGTVRSLQPVAQGIDFYQRQFGESNRWGDFSGMSIDPAGDATFCAFNQYALARGTISSSFPDEDGRWGSRWGCFSFISEITSLIGDKDGFQSGDTVDAPPRSQNTQDILAFLDQANFDPGVDLDESGVDRPVGLTHFFTLPADAQITSATVNFRVKGAQFVKNDGIFYDETELPPTQDLPLPLIALRDLPGRDVDTGEDKEAGVELEVGQTLELELDLGRAPVRTVNTSGGPGESFSTRPEEYRNLLSLLNGGQFDMVFADDVTVDFSELRVTFVLPSTPLGDLTGDDIVDRDDLDIIVAALNTDATKPDDPRDINSDGRITVLDARKLVVLCWENGRPRCAK